MRRVIRIALGLVIAELFVPGSLRAQFDAPGPPAVGEQYHVELSGGFWSPTPELVVSSASLGLQGTDVDFISDLGVEKKRFREFRLVLRPARKHKFRIQYVPVRYAAEASLPRDIVFNGTRFPAGLDVVSSLEWRAWRFAYEYDLLYRSRGFIGLIVEVKYTQVEASIETPLLVLTESARARAPIPAVGGIARGYILPQVAVTFELTGFKIPERIDEDLRGRYLEFDLYGTGNFSENFGVQVGYRSMDVNYLIDEDSGALAVRGLYLLGVARF